MQNLLRGSRAGLNLHVARKEAREQLATDETRRQRRTILVTPLLQKSQSPKRGLAFALAFALGSRYELRWAHKASL